MRFWPFGKRDEDVTDLGTRVVTAKSADGAMLRGKIAIHFVEALPRAAAEELLDQAASMLQRTLERADDAAGLLEDPSTLAAEVAAELGASRVRSAELLALHALGELPGKAASVRPSSRPPPRGPMPSRRVTSSQMLAVRDSRLIPEGAPPEVVASSLVPLLKDSATRLLIASVRAYDLCVVRKLDVDPDAPDDFSELVPLSTAAPGRFASDRAGELGRWEDTLGDETVRQLSFEATAVVCYFLHYNLGGSGLAPTIATTILEAAAEQAFPDDPPLGGMSSYVSGSPSDARQTYSAALARLTGAEATYSPKLAAVVAATIVSLQSDFAFVAQQVFLSGVKGA